MKKTFNNTNKNLKLKEEKEDLDIVQMKKTFNNMNKNLTKIKMSIEHLCKETPIGLFKTSLRQ